MDLLGSFASYEQGKPVAMVSDTRQSVFAGTADEMIRAAREKDLLRFIASDANHQAKAIAIEWLGCLGSPASVPGLVAAREKTPELAAPVAAALKRIPGPEARRALLVVTLDKPVIHPSAAAVAKFSGELAAASDRKAADTLLLQALRSDNDLLAGTALRRIRAGAGSPALVGVVGKLPAARQTMLCDALSTRSDSIEFLRPVLLDRVRDGEPETRSAALPLLGRVLREMDLPMLLDLAADSDRSIRDAARAAFLRATNPTIDPALIRLTTTPGSPHAVLAIEILADRAASKAVEPLWTVAGKGDPKLAPAALKALGSLIPPGDLPSVLAKCTASAGGPLADDYSNCVWNVVRRNPDPASAADMLEKAATGSPEPVKATLIRHATRIRPKTNGGKAELDLPRQDDRLDLAPNGYEETACLNCGSFQNASGGGVTIRRIAGESYRFGAVAHPLATVDFGKEIAYEINGLDSAADYVIGFSAWDADLGRRRESLLVDGKACLTDFAPLAWHADKPTFTRIHLPLAREATADGKVSLVIKATAGPNAVLSELWLLKRKEDKRRKRIVILTGDDYPAHHWRETGPEFAKILRADPRLEVTISESPALLGSPLLFSYDAVFLHFKNYADRLPTTRAERENLAAYVRGGGGLVIAHFGCGAMQEWNGFVETSGRVWDPEKRGHDPYGEFAVRILDTGHPVTSGLKDFTTHDELYTCLAGDTPITVLAEATSRIDKSVQPMAFVLTPGKGRVFHSPLGHDLGALKADGVHALYLRGTLWAAGL